VDDGRLALIASADLLAELADVCDRPRIRDRITPEDAALVRHLLAEKALFFDPADNPQACRDPRDDYLLGLAAASGAEYLVSRDEDLLVLRRYAGTEIVHPARFLQLLEEPAEPPADPLH
jgi:putative PIN family toxin of toxin-antitoxin system